MGKTRGKAKVTRPAGARTVSLAELARRQGVKPVADLDDLGALLPADFDPDAFAAFIAEERAARRKVVKK